MATKVMTKDELTDLIAKWADDKVAGLVKTAVEAQVAPLAQRQTDWMERMLGNGGGRHEEPKPVAERSLRFGRIVRAGAASTMALRAGQVISAEDILTRWGEKALADEIAQGRQKAMAAGDATAGGFLVPPQYSQDVIEFLRGASVVRRLGARSIPVPTGTLKVPKLTTGSTAFYVGENANATLSQLGTGLLSLSFKKLVTMVPVSNDLIRYSSPGADALVRDDCVNGMRVREDQAFIRDDGTAGSPKGLRFWAHADNILEQTASASIQNTFTDLGRLVQKLLEANIPMLAPAWIMAPRTQMFLQTLITTTGIPVFRDEMSGGRLWGFPFGVSTNVPTNLAPIVANVGKSELYLVDMAQVLLGESMTLMVDASQEAAYFDGTSMQAAYSLDQTVVRAIAEHDLGVRHDKAVAVMTQLTWAPGSV